MGEAVEADEQRVTDDGETERLVWGMKVGLVQA